MAEFRDKMEWKRTAWICQYIHNCNAMSDGDKQVRAIDCNPYFIAAKEQLKQSGKLKKKKLPDKYNASKMLQALQAAIGR